MLRGVSNFSAKSLRRRFVMWWHMHENQILVHLQIVRFSNFIAFSNNCNQACPKFIFHDSLVNFSSCSHSESSITRNSWLIIVTFYRKWEKIKWLENALKFEFQAYAITWQISFEDFLHFNLTPPPRISSSETFASVCIDVSEICWWSVLMVLDMLIPRFLFRKSFESSHNRTTCSEVFRRKSEQNREF